MDEAKNEKGFVVKDRRLFDESGAARKEEPKTTDGGKTAAPRPAPPSPPEPEKAGPENEPETSPEVSFAGFILSLSTTAMYHFGDFPDPVTKEAQRNLAAAKQTIDLLNILKAKTEGNLQEDEKQLLDGLLFELRMRFVKEMSAK